MSDVPSFAYRLLWGERIIQSVANLTRDDTVGFLQLAATMPLKLGCSLTRSMMPMPHSATSGQDR